MTSPTLIHAYHRLHPNRALVLRFHDCIENGLPNRNVRASAIKSMVSSLLADGVISSAESYSVTDAKYLAVPYRPNGVHPQRIRELEESYRTHLLYFKGGAKLNNSGNRLSSLTPILAMLADRFPQISHWIDTNTVTVWRPYPEYLRESLLTEVVVDLVRISEDEGFSFRVPEALFLNRKIITNRQSILQEPFYSPERVFFVGLDDPERLPEFLKRDIDPLPDEILKLYDATLWWTERDPVAHPEHKDSYP